MGLDMYAFSVKQGADVELEDTERDQMAYWRKFNALHGFMEDLYRERDGQGDFNCVALQLTPADIDELESAITENTLRPRGGFFFGNQEIYPEDIESTKVFIKDARDAFGDGKDVYYDSWW